MLLTPDFFDPVKRPGLVENAVTDLASITPWFSRNDDIGYTAQVIGEAYGLYAHSDPLEVPDESDISLPEVLNAKNRFSSPSPKVEVYPNPANNLLYIRYDFNQKADKGYVSVCDISGRHIMSTTLENDKSFTALDISCLKPGVYFIRVYVNGNPILIQKQIIQK